MTNLLDTVFSKEDLTRNAKVLLLYLIGQKLAQKALPEPAEIDNLGLLFGEDDAYDVLYELSKYGYIKEKDGSLNDYKLDYRDLAPLVKPLESSGNAPKTAPDLFPSVLDLLKLFRTLHVTRKGNDPITGTNDLLMMRGICRQLKTAQQIDALFDSFFKDAANMQNKNKRFGVAELKQHGERIGLLKTKFNVKSR